MRKVAIAMLFLAFGIAGQAQEVNDWENPQVLGINKEPYHATLTLPSRRYECGECVSLDGMWKFRWYPRPEQRETEFFSKDYDVSAWDDIVVPGEWQMQGYGIPIYTNWTMPFRKDQPLCFRTWPWTEQDIEAAGHPYDLTKRDYINVNLDLNIHGVGCNDGWGARTLDKYTINADNPYSYGFILSCE